MDLERLCSQSDEFLARDVARNNLVCATGLPGAPSVGDCAECVNRLDSYASSAKEYTERQMHYFRRDPAAFATEARFRVLCLVTHLHHAHGLHYHTDRRGDDAAFETDDCFIHGALLGRGGTCASLPVVYVAVGRRLGYPLRLVSAPCHLLCRWDEPGGERFNVEVNDTGLSTPPDEYYVSGRHTVEPWLLRQTIFLKSQSPREELAGFLSQRGRLWRELGNYKEAAEAFIWAAHLAPDHRMHGSQVISTLLKWRQALDRRLPPYCPAVQMRLPPVRRYPESLPAAIEGNVIRLEVLESLLNDPGFERSVARPLRESPQCRPPHIPDRCFVNVTR